MIAFILGMILAWGFPVMPVAASPGFVWGTAELIETDADDAFRPQVAMDALGNAVAVWPQLGGIWANRFVPGIGWGTAEPIETDAGGVFGLQVAVDPQGNAVAVWDQHDGTRSNIWANRFVPGLGWGTAELIETDAGTAFSPQVAIDPQGNAVAVWNQHDGTRRNIWANRFVPGLGWGTAEPIETDDAGSAVFPQVAVDSQGNATAVWRQTDGTRFNIWANRFVPGVGWGTAELIETDAGHAGFPQVAVDSQGNATAVWDQSASIWANRFVPGLGWGTAELIETGTGGVSNAQVAVEPKGNATAVWRQSASIWANRFVPGVGWGTAELVETDAGVAFDPQVAVDSQGNAVAVWNQHDGTRSNIWANRFVPGVGWGTAEMIETDAGDAFNAQVAVEPKGNATAVWRQSANIWANRFAEDIDPPDLVITSPIDGAMLTSTLVTVTGTASDDVGVDKVELSTDGMTWVLATGTTSWSGTVTLAEGPNTIFARATDTAGNTATVSIAVTVDTPPTVAITSPADGAVLPSTSMVVSGTASDSEGVEMVELSLDGTTYVLATGTTSWSGTLTLAEGPNTIFARATDTAGNTATVSVAVTVDTANPTVAITSPADGADLASSSVTVSGTASDDGGVDKVELSADGTTYFLATGTTSWSGTLTFAEGPNAIFARATDTAGNTATVSIAVTVDTVAPTAVAGEDQKANAGAMASFDASASSDDVAIVSYEWDFGDGTTGTGETTTHIYTDPGTYTVILTVRDAAGNADTDVLIVTVETEPVNPIPPEVVTFGVVGALAAVAAGVALLLWRRRSRGKEKA